MSIEVNCLEQVSGDHYAVDLPYDHPRPPFRSSRTDSEVRLALTPLLIESADLLAQRECIPVRSVYFAAYSIVLSRYNGKPEVPIDISSSICPGRDLANALGHTGHPRTVRFNCTPELNLRTFLRTIADSIASLEVAETNVQEQANGLGHVGFCYDDAPDCESPDSARTGSVTDECCDIKLRVKRFRDTVEASLRYDAELFEADTIDRISRHLTRLLEEIVSKPSSSIAELEMMSDDERLLLLGLYAGGNSVYPWACLHELFAEHARLRPEAEALVYGTERLTYGQLDLRSNQVAQFLVGEGINLEDRVGIFMNRSTDMIVGMLGVLKAGGTYVPIDVDYPAEQIKFIAKDTGLRWILTQDCLRAVCPDTAPAASLNTADSPIRRASAEPVTNRSTPESIAVVNYTSGSTGRPKAACIPHRAVVRTVRDTNYVQIELTDKIAQAGSPSFDAAIMEIWLALANGATVVGLNRETLLSPADLANVLQTQKISILVLNTSYVHQIGRDAPGALKGVRKVLFGGEAAEPGPLRSLVEKVGPGVLVNGYGPAEGCVITTYHEIATVPLNARTVPIGRPVSNARVYLLDEFQRPVPILVRGEIYIGGDGVALGYLNRPDLTAQRFISDPFSEKAGQLLYRTGDFARMRSNGEIEFLGRTDEQVKIRGHRIELAEVRHAIAAHPDLEEVVLMVREDVPGDKRLIAYVTPRSGCEASQDSLRQHTAEKLPAHMVPAAFVVLDSMPRNVNGKVDRRALPPPKERPKLDESYRSPKTDLETELTQIWQELLRVEQIGVNDNFFDLGGHSLLAARLIARIEKQVRVNIPMATLFEAPTIAQLTARLKQRSYESAWSPLVELHVPYRSMTAQPFFCVHSLGANLVSFRNVAALMHGERAIYGLQPHGLDGRQKPFATIETMASAYLREIRKKQASGPYLLGGVCLGGVVAYEMAQQLRAAGEAVTLVAMIDSYLPGKLSHLHSRSPLTEYLDRHLGEMLLLPGAARLKYLARWIANGGIRFGRALGLREKSSLAEATREVAAVHCRAIFSYEAKPYVGKVAQLMCSDAASRSYEDRRLAWSALLPAGMEVRLIPGNHHTMVEAPYAQVLAHELETCLDRANAAPSPIRKSNVMTFRMPGARHSRN